jgi:hypothetical protein
MSAAFALMLLAEAVTTCPTSTAPRLGGGAALVREGGTVDSAPFERLGPTTSVVTRPVDIQQTHAEQAGDQPQDGEPAAQCTPVAFPIA